MKRRLSRILLIVAAIATIMSLSVSAAPKPINLVFGSVYAAQHEYSRADMYFKELVEKGTNGEVRVDYYPAGQLGSEREMLEATISGAQAMLQTTPGTLATLFPKIGTLELPYLFRDREHYYKALNQVFPEINNELVKVTGLRVIFWRERSPRHLSCNIPVKSLNDIKGLKIRVSEVPLRVALWRALGTNPIALPMNEVYSSLATGIINAQENPLDTFYSAKIYEQQKYIILTEHMREVSCIVINEKVWKSLSPEHQKVILEAGQKSSDMANQLVYQADIDLRGTLRDLGVTILEIDQTEFAERAKTIWNDFGDKALYELIQSIE